MDVVNPEQVRCLFTVHHVIRLLSDRWELSYMNQARIAEEAGACAVMALERVPADIRAQGGVARMVGQYLLHRIVLATLRCDMACSFWLTLCSAIRLLRVTRI
jgi:SOR/SNZ family